MNLKKNLINIQLIDNFSKIPLIFFIIQINIYNTKYSKQKKNNNNLR